MSAALLAIIIPSVLAIIALILTQRSAAKALRNDLQMRDEALARETSERDEALRQRVAAIEIKVDVFWSGLMKDTAKILYQTTEIQRDDLLEKLLADEITSGEIEALRVMLRVEIAQADISHDMGPKLAAAVLLNLLEGAEAAQKVKNYGSS